MIYDFDTYIGDQDAAVRVDFTPGTPRQTSGPPERCYEGDPDEVEILSCLINGEEYPLTDEEAEELTDRLTELCIDRLRDDIYEARAARNERDWD